MNTIRSGAWLLVSLAMATGACAMGDDAGVMHARARDGGGADGAAARAGDDGSASSEPGDGGDGGATRGDGGAASDACVSGAREVCDNGLDDNCDGRIDEDCPCGAGATQRCFDGPAALAGVGACHWGMQVCNTAGELGTWGACAGSGAPRAEICGNHVDDDCNGVVDDGVCNTCQTPPAGRGGTVWQQLGPQSVQCTLVEPRNATLPDMTSGAWSPHANPTIQFGHASAGMCPPYNPSVRASGVCACDNYSQFTFFRTRLEVPGDPAGHTLRITLGTVDDRAAVSIVNSAHPTGVVVAEAVIGTGLNVQTGDLGRLLASGTNWIVVVHADTCCWWSSLENVRVLFDEHPVPGCP